MISPAFSRARGSSFLALAAALAATGLGAPAFAEEMPHPVAEEATAPAPVDTSIATWGIEETDYEADPGVVYGVLDNGMRYALRRNTQPEGEASIRFLFEVGTRDERAEEEGAAHFVEHMAFNGSTNIPEGELVPRLERLGLAFGADTNAETYPNYTMYKLDLPKLDEETVASSLDIMREIASELTITPEAVEREKGIIVSEYQVRNTAQQRQTVKLLEDIMADDHIAQRVVAEPEATRSLTAETLRGFYEGYYRPERATMVIVGDFDIAEMERQIVSRFSSWEGTGEARKPFDAQIATLDDLKVNTFVDPSATDVAQLQRLKPYSAPTNTAEEYRADLMDQIATFAINERMAELVRAEGATVIGGAALSQDLFQSAKLYGVVTLPKDGDWASAIAVAEQEWRRAAEHGFTNSEIANARTNILSNLQNAVKQSNSVSNAAIAGGIINSSLGDSVRMSPEGRLALYERVADTITPEAVKANFLANWGEGPNYALVSTKTAVEGGIAAISTAIGASMQVAVAAPVEAVDKAWAYTDFGTPGEIAATGGDAELGITTVRFANGVQLNMKKTDFEPGSVSVQVEVGNGISRITDRPGLGLMAQVVGGADDLGEHAATELTRLFAGKRVGYGYNLSGGTIIMSRTTTPQDLELQLQAIAAQITDTAFSAQAQRQWEGLIPLLSNNLTATAQAVFGAGYPAVLTGGDARFGISDPAVLGALSMEDLKVIVGDQFANAPIEIGVVGDIDEEAVKAAVASTLGALDRPAVYETAQIPPVTFASPDEVKYLYHKGEAEQGMIALTWPTTDASDLRSTLTRRLLAQLIDLEALKVLREELGATYTPNGSSSASTVFDGYGYIGLSAPAEPATMDEVSKVVRELVAGFAETAPSADDLQRARQPILESYERSARSNGTWAAYVVDAQSDADQLDVIRNRSEIMASITPEEVLAAAKEYLAADPIELRVVPAPAAATGE